MITIIAIPEIPIIKENDNLGKIICETAKKAGIKFLSGDILVIAQSIVSRAEGRVVDLKTINPSSFALAISQEVDKDPQLVEVILRETKSIVRMGRGHLIVETKVNGVCANAGVDRSNVPGENFVSLLPLNSDTSARRIYKEIKEITGEDVAIIISDTHGRPLREGAINVAIGVAEIIPILNYKGKKDLFGYVLETTKIAVADELASAAELVMGQSNEALPVILIRGYNYQKGFGSAKELIRPAEKDLFW